MDKVIKTMLIKNVKAAENENGSKEFTAIASTTAVDRHGEIVTEEALEGIVENTKSVPLQADHSYSVFNTLGRVDILGVEGNGLKIKGTLSENENGLYIYNLLKMGAIDKMSVGFIPVEMENDREYKKVELLEVSLVVAPANREAEVIEVKKIGNKSNKKGKEMEESKVEELFTMIEEISNDVKNIMETVNALAEEKAGEEKETQEEKEYKEYLKRIGAENE